jgi:hypothetical protein
MSNELPLVVTVTFHEQALTEINELNNHFTRAGFVLTLNDEEGTSMSWAPTPLAC